MCRTSQWGTPAPNCSIVWYQWFRVIRSGIHQDQGYIQLQWIQMNCGLPKERGAIAHYCWARLQFRWPRWCCWWPQTSVLAAASSPRPCICRCGPGVRRACRSPRLGHQRWRRRCRRSWRSRAGELSQGQSSLSSRSPLHPVAHVGKNQRHVPARQARNKAHLTDTITDGLQLRVLFVSCWHQQFRRWPFVLTWTRYSLSASRALVASSRRSTRGFISKALAMAILCFCPPDNLIPRSPTTVLYWSGKLHMKLCAFAIFCIRERVDNDVHPAVVH